MKDNTTMKITKKEEAPEIELNNSAFSIYKNLENNMWTIAKITFDAKTSTVGKLEIMHEDVSRDYVHERFRIAVSTTLFRVE